MGHLNFAAWDISNLRLHSRRSEACASPPAIERQRPVAREPIAAGRGVLHVPENIL